MGLRTGRCAGQSSSSTPNFFNHVFMELDFVHWGSCWNRKGPSPNCSHKMSQYFEALRFLFTGTKGKPNPRNTAQYHYPSSTKLCCLITLHNVIRQVTLYYLPILDLSIRLPNREARIFHLHRTGFYCSRVQ